MDITLANTLESQFGPASELIDIPKFLKAAAQLPTTTNIPNNPGDPSNLYRQAIQQTQIEPLNKPQISVAEIRNDISQQWNQPKVSAHLQRAHTKKITIQPATSKRKRKAFEEEIDSEVQKVKEETKNISLKSWSLPNNTLFVRPSKHSDHNVLVHPRSTSDFVVTETETQAVLTISVHSKISWAPSYVTRTSQHALVSTQTLGDLLKTIACVSDVQFSDNMTEDISGVVCIEGKLYSDGRTEDNYASKLINYLQSKQKPKAGDVMPAALEQAGTSISDTQLQSLLLRLHEPYWFLHHGSCEHFIVVDQIRLLHPSDPKTGYPLTLFVPPTILDLCRGCKTVPATISVIGDIRLGETPCLMCSPCWKNMGEAKDIPGLQVIPLAREERIFKLS